MDRGKVLITGRHGFTGHYVADALSAAGWQVCSLSNHATADLGPFDRVAALTDAAAVTRAIAEIRPDAVVHLAAIAFVAHGSADDFYRVNLMGTRNLLDALAREGCGSKGVVLASSANIYGNSRISPIPETTQPAPVNDYAVSKLAMEHMAGLFSDKLPLVITRPFNYTGVGQDPKFLVPKIVAGFRERAPRLELGNLNVARDFSDVRDVAQVYRALLDAEDVRGCAVNICSGHAPSLQEIVGLCRRLSGHDLEVVVNPDFVRADEIKVLKGDPTRMNALTGGLTRHRFEDTLGWMLDVWEGPT